MAIQKIENGAQGEVAKKLAQNLFEIIDGRFDGVDEGILVSVPNNGIPSVASVMFTRAEMYAERDRFVKLLPKIDPFGLS